MIRYKRKYVIRSGLIVGGFVALLSGNLSDQGSGNPFFVALVLSVPAYFFLLKWLYPVMRDEGARPNPLHASDGERWSIWGAILIVLTILLKVLVAISFSEPKVYSGVVVEKKIYKNKYDVVESSIIRLGGDDHVYFDCSYHRYFRVTNGWVGHVVYRDSLLGVRRIVEYDLTPPDPD